MFLSSYIRTASYTKHIKRFLSVIRRSFDEHLTTDKLRNIGILAHIDAGKTTTTERMLFYSGTIRSMGEVHHGNTVTDFLEQERERGITIMAAAVSFPWNEHQFNLIDTPGHIDFTMEVEQSLGVIDGAVVILDSSAGVEAQTLTVWRQCDDHNLPRIVYINKMDRRDSNINLCLNTLREKLDANPISLHLPIKDVEGKLKGIVDIINVECLLWNTESKGRTYTKDKLTESDGSIWENTMNARRTIVDTLSEYDDKLADLIIQSESLDTIESTLLKESLRKATLNQDVYPVLCGSSYKNIAVQTLMDAIIEYLPSPLERNQMYNCFGNELSARAFKVQHDDQKGVLTFFRIFSGTLTKSQKIFNIPKQKPEQTGTLYVPYADEYQSVSEIKHGNVAVVSGLKATMTGDIITSTQTASISTKKKIMDALKDSKKIKELCLPNYIQNKISFNEEDFDIEEAGNKILGMGAIIPDPVFLCSIEPPSMAYQTELDIALAELQREDPSLRVTNNAETGQTVLAGMGELHLQIIRERILTEYKIDAELGSLQIAYKESIKTEGKDSHTIESRIGGSRHFVNLTLSAYPKTILKNKDILRFDTSHDSASNLSHVHPKNVQALKLGVESALMAGPKIGYPLVDIGVTIHWLEVAQWTAETFVAAAVTQCLRKIFRNCESVILEPVMNVEVVCPDEYATRVINDLSRRRTMIKQYGIRGKNKVIECQAPLSELMGYSTDLRSLSSGTASFTMEFFKNLPMSPIEEENAMKSIRGF